MGSKIGFILSMFLAFQIMFIISDLFSLQVAQTSLDSLSNSVSLEISEQGYVRKEFKDYLLKKYATTLTCVNTCSGNYGDIITFSLSKEVKQFMSSEKIKTIQITRCAVVGYNY